LIECGANINEVTSQGSPLFFAEQRNASKVCEVLKKKSAVSTPPTQPPAPNSIPTGVFLKEVLLLDEIKHQIEAKTVPQQPNPAPSQPEPYDSSVLEDIFQVELSSFLNSLKGTLCVNLEELMTSLTKVIFFQRHEQEKIHHII
jgi:hypothetical protein